MVDPIKFGASISTSGRYALQGNQALGGLLAWAKASSRESGPKRQVAVAYYDDASSPELAASNTERLIEQDRVDILLGPYASDLTRAVLPVAIARSTS
jgi:branched-chain amino acid transport system substrate-binding protein